MIYGLLALLTRSLRQDARQLRNHVFRLTFVAFIYIGLLWATITAASYGAPGLHFFKNIAWLNALFITCAGIGFFASAITEEKEEETLGLLTMAGLNPLGILLGKSTSRLIQASLLLIVQMPFMLLAVTLGGVTPHQILAAYAALLAFMTLLANVALVWSTVCERGGSAAGLTTLLLAIYFVLPMFAPQLTTACKAAGITSGTSFGHHVLNSLEWIGESCVYLRLNKIMETGFKDPIVSRQVISNLVGGMACFLFAWVLFVPCTKNSNSGAVSRGMVLRKGTRIRFLSPGRSWALPLTWKDFQFITGGYSFAIAKFVLYDLLALVIALTMTDWNVGTLTLDNVAQPYVMCMMGVVVVESSILAARIFHDEVRLQTLSSLLILPRSIPYVAYSKTLGCLMGLVPSVCCLLVGALLLPGVSLEVTLDSLVNPLLWGFVLILIVFLHLVALLSLFVKWGALPLGIVLMLPLSGCCPVYSLLMLVATQGGLRDTMGSFAATVTVWILMGLICFVFQMMIASRLQEIGAK